MTHIIAHQITILFAAVGLTLPLGIKLNEGPIVAGLLCVGACSLLNLIFPA